MWASYLPTFSVQLMGYGVRCQLWSEELSRVAGKHPLPSTDTSPSDGLITNAQMQTFNLGDVAGGGRGGVYVLE